MRMSPRLKARRGRFGPGGLSGPVLKIVSPANGSSVQAGGSPIVFFVGTAVDDLDGDLSASIGWSTGVGSPLVADATGASVNLATFLSVGANTVTATVVDSGGKRSTVSIAITGT